MERSWEEICVGDVITVKVKNKHACVYVADIPGRPLTRSDTIEVIDFYNNNISNFFIDFEQFCNIDAYYYEANNYKYKVGSLVEVVLKKERLMGTIISFHEPKFSYYPENGRTKIHTFFSPQYTVMFTDASILPVEEKKIKIISNPS